MSSKKLSTHEDLVSYRNNKAFIRIFKYAPLKQYDYLICVHGDRGQGAKGEVAHLKVGESTYNAIAELYPIAERESHLFRSDFFDLDKLQGLVHQHESTPVSSEESV